MTENQLRYLAHQESIRHNLQTEALERSKQGETARHNLQSETFTEQSLEETARSNLAREAETNRSNVVREEETERHNRWQEALGVVDRIGTASKEVREWTRATSDGWIQSLSELKSLFADEYRNANS